MAQHISHSQITLIFVKVYLNTLKLIQMLYLWETGTALWMIPCAPTLETTITASGDVLGKYSIFLKAGLISIQLLNLIVILLLVLLTTIGQDLTGHMPNKLRSKIFLIIIYSLLLLVIIDAIFIKIKWGPRPRWGKGSWKMNTQVLDDPRFELGLKQIIVIFNENKYINMADSWEALKSQVKKNWPRKLELNSVKKKTVN